MSLVSELQRRKGYASILAVLVAMAALACSGGSKGDMVSVKLALDWYPNSNHLGLFIAQEKGYFEDENLDVTLYTPVDPSTVLLTVGSGKDDFGISYQPDVLLARAQGVPVVSIAGIVQHPLNSVVALKSSGITRPRELVGKKVGYPGIPTNEPLLETMLKFDGLSGLPGGLIRCDEADVGGHRHPVDDAVQQVLDGAQVVLPLQVQHRRLQAEP